MPEGYSNKFILQGSSKHDTNTAIAVEFYTYLVPTRSEESFG
jgi:hypothetical protein